ncbi:hypothetical protein TcasGA2_TC013841 [Tribolium castaneum]|uniref:Uncharacterized protein n=1 Tax=Tribolium castaneum TaxID=7070 RepID=D6WNT0_TRICA|nr:hypothetical protein TcasGA2_TC013841 [Tribolium castaneum]
MAQPKISDLRSHKKIYSSSITIRTGEIRSVIIDFSERRGGKCCDFDRSRARNFAWRFRAVIFDLQGAY